MRIFLLLAMTVLIPLHSAQSKPLETSVYGNVGGVDVEARKIGTAGLYYWTSAVGSLADEDIGTIGYTWWTKGQYCVESGAWSSWNTYDGDVNYVSDTYYWLLYNNYVNCPFTQTYQLQNLGTHDFKEGGDTWRPTVNKIITITP